MEYCKHIIGKQLEELTLEDLKIFFSIDRIETSTLEFKSGETKSNGLFNKCDF